MCTGRIRNHRCSVFRGQRLATSPTQPLFSELSEPRQVPRHQRNTFFSVKKGWLKTASLHCGRSVTVCPALLARKEAFLLEIEAGLWGDVKGGGALGPLCSTDDLLFDWFCCQRWWWLMLTSNTTGLSWSWMSFLLIFVPFYNVQHYFHAQTGWRFLLLGVSLY